MDTNNIMTMFNKIFHQLAILNEGRDNRRQEGGTQYNGNPQQHWGPPVHQHWDDSRGASDAHFQHGNYPNPAPYQTGAPTWGNRDHQQPWRTENVGHQPMTWTHSKPNPPPSHHQGHRPTKVQPLFPNFQPTNTTMPRVPTGNQRGPAATTTPRAPAEDQRGPGEPSLATNLFRLIQLRHHLPNWSTPPKSIRILLEEAFLLITPPPSRQLLHG